jgi:hypothetical protein
MSIPRTIARGAAAGTIGTLAMDLLWYARYRRGGGERSFPEWEITRDVKDWSEAPAPGQMARKVIEGVTGRDVPVERAGAISNAMHWSYGVAWATTYSVVTKAAGRRWWAGLLLGTTVWASDYVVLPLAGVYEPIWRYDLETLAEDLSAHLVFGTTTDAALRVL